MNQQELDANRVKPAPTKQGVQPQSGYRNRKGRNPGALLKTHPANPGSRKPCDETHVKRVFALHRHEGLSRKNNCQGRESQIRSWLDPFLPEGTPSCFASHWRWPNLFSRAQSIRSIGDMPKTTEVLFESLALLSSHRFELIRHRRFSRSLRLLLQRPLW